MHKTMKVIEDEKAISDVIAYALKREGYTVEVVDRGDLAVKRINETQPRCYYSRCDAAWYRWL